MGWGRFLLLGDLGQQLDLSDQTQMIEQLRAGLQETREVAADWAREAEHLRAENDELKLYLAALIRLLVSKGLVTREEVTRFVDAVDQEDGAKDRKFKGRI